MSIDITQQVKQIATETIQQAATQAVQDAVQQGNQTVKDAATALHQESLTLIGGLGSRLAKLEQQGVAALPQLETRLLTVGDAVAKNAEHDVWIPRMIVGILGVAGLIILAGYVLGSHQAAAIWGWLVLTFGGAVAVSGRNLLTTILGPKTPPMPGA